MNRQCDGEALNWQITDHDAGACCFQHKSVSNVSQPLIESLSR